MRSLNGFVLTTFICILPLVGLTEPISKALPDGELRGQAAFRYLGFKLYEARLFTKGGRALNWSEDFGIELTYKRKLSQNDLVEATLRELRRMGNAMPIREPLERCYQGVQSGDRYLAVSQGPDRLTFWRNGRMVCTLNRDGIKNNFMAIFLSENSRSPRFSRALLGQ